MSSISEANELLKADRLDDALAMLNELIEKNPDNAELFFTRGKTFWRLGERAMATNDYAVSARLCPDGPASKALEHARDIADFFNPEMFNP